MKYKEVDKKGIKSTKGITILVVFLVILIGVVVLLINLFTPKTTYTSTGGETVSTQSLYCTTKSKDIPEAFFDISDAESANQSIKIIFKNKKIDNISYNADIIYKNAGDAKTAEAKLYAAYGNHLQNNGKDINAFSPNFSVVDNNVKIGLYAETKQLNNQLAKVFLIDTNDSLSSYTSKVLSTLYKSKGFNCEGKE
ncbi:hypothetical protein J6S55_02265 [Candidatus Saccharibacteria bacterium]|nr:hypothetical protein [Candidatus Saccharibacteria bacterium]